MSEVAEKAAEATAEVVEESIDGVVETLEVMRNNPVTLALVGAAGLVAGGAVGYFVARKTLRSFYEDLASTEIEQAKEFYAGVYKTDPDGAVLSPMEVLESRHGSEAAAEALRGYQGRQAAEKILERDEMEVALDEQDEAQVRRLEERRRHEVEETPDEVIETVTETRNVFIDPNFDYDEEVKHRTKDKPYIITHDEYFEAGKDYDTVSLTYFEDDDTLTNERDEPIREIDKMIGEDHLVRFGHASKDKNIVYVRNDRLETDFEIIKSTGSYVEQVLGMLDGDDDSTTLKHSADQRRAFRRGEG